MAVHLASQRVMEKSGLTLTRAFRQPRPHEPGGDEHGNVEYALSKADWERQEAASKDPAER
jgi:RimJ/RimL family protein N-acetyltransferase